ncbi:MAG: hypothetical protein RML40_02240, partial [Bacteroidota bacterium]|nr:hypothetical protein [Candidatus Kapabacteria bacterium]MDW8219329.1 hypothetical protein [Bacteroidota bacterium]
YYCRMEVWIQLSLILALTSFSALCLYAIATLQRLRRALRSIQSLEQALNGVPANIREAERRIAGILDNLESLTRAAALLMQQLHQDMQFSTGIFGEVEALSLQLRRLREFLQTGIVEPLGTIARTVRALGKASQAFNESLRKSKAPESALYIR